MTRRNLQLFGPVRVESDDGDVPRFRSQRTMALLGYLVAERRAISRDALAALFWPDETQSKGRGSLRRELHNLSQILPDCWEADRRSVQFAPSNHTRVDLFRFLEFEQTEQWAEAAALVRGDFLEGLYLDDNLEFETWLLGERERWRQRAESVLTRVVELHTRQAAYTAALDSARKLLQLTPWNEAIHRQVMLLLARTGQRGAAIKQYALCQTTLQEELGVAVSAETTALYERIKRSTTFLMHNIPALTTPLIGRERELSLLEGWLDNPQVRLITITGAGGMGKTRLSLALARGEAQAWENPEKGGVRFPDGVYFISMVSLNDTAQMAPAIAIVLHFPLQGQDSRSPQEQLFDYLQNKEMLLILDNLEHLLDDIGLVSELLQAAPQVQIVATSRARLQLRGEQILALDGLDYSDAETGPAARLFLKTARRIKPHFQLKDEDAGHLSRICTLVEGMPLALELAASWIDTLSLAEIASEVERGVGFLETEARDIPARHRSIRAVFDTAWQRLSPSEQNLFAKLSIFRDGFILEASLNVTDATLPQLAALAGKSLVRYSHEQNRYDIHDLLRQYGAEKLAQTPVSEIAVRDRHSVYYCVRLAEQEDGIRIVREHRSRTPMAADYENVRMAWNRALAQKDMERLTAAVNSLGHFYMRLARYLEGEVAFESLVAKLEMIVSRSAIDARQHHLLAKALTWYGDFADLLGRRKLASQLFERSLAILESPLLAQTDTRAALAHILECEGDTQHGITAKEKYQRCLALSRDLGDRWREAVALHSLSETALFYGLGTHNEIQQLSEDWTLAIFKPYYI